MRAIDADKLSDSLLKREREIRCFGKDVKELEDCHRMIDLVDQQPTIEVVKRGKWIDDGDCFICSNCRKAFGFLSAKCVTNFCPDCGADMRSGEK
jgi:hypothetical protein